MQIRNIARTFIFGVKYLTPPTLNVDAALTLKGANRHLLISVQIGGQRHSSLGDAPLFKTGVVKSFTRNIDIRHNVTKTERKKCTHTVSIPTKCIGAKNFKWRNLWRDSAVKCGGGGTPIFVKWFSTHPWYMRVCGKLRKLEKNEF